MTPTNGECILDEAKRLVYGDRCNDYGHPADDYAKVAKIWTGILLPKLKEGVEITPVDAALCMVGIKIAREANRPKRDNLVDGAGYFAVIERIRQREARA
jgi:hypothetical protein